MKDRSKVTVTAEMHQETPRHPSVERKQRIPVQMIKTQGRFLMQMADIPVNVEVISSNAKQALVSSVVQTAFYPNYANLYRFPCSGIFVRLLHTERALFFGECL